MPKIREQLIQNSILEYIRLRGIYAWRQNTGAVKTKNSFVRYGFPGLSDILGILPDGRFLAIECKAEDGKPTREQLQFLNEVKKRGGLALIARSLDQVMKALEGEL